MTVFKVYIRSREVRVIRINLLIPVKQYVPQGNHYNWTREACDKALLHDMIQSCHRRMHSRTRRGVMNALLDIWYFFQGISKEERRCKLAAEMYYKIVRTFGASHFEKKDHIYCINTCADKHGSPSVEL